MELNAACRQPRQLCDDVWHARVVEQHLARLPGRRVHRHVERREAIFEDAVDVALLHVRQRREVAIRKRQPVIVVADVQVFPQSLRQPLDEAELAPIRASAHGRRHQLDTDRLALRSLDLVEDLFAAWQTGFDDEVVVGRKKLPIEEVPKFAAIHRQQFGSRNDLELFSDASCAYLADSNHCAPGPDHQCNGGRSAIFPHRVYRPRHRAASAHAR